jgi:hypothetical protein
MASSPRQSVEDVLAIVLQLCVCVNGGGGGGGGSM